MTDRRSVQTNDARVSRAFQFVPGHVSGRVASAQPVRYRRHVGGISVPQGTPPTGMTIHTGGAYYGVGGWMWTSGLQGAFPAFPVGMTSAVALVGTSGYDGGIPPAGWTVLESGGPFGTGNVVGGWMLLSIDNPTGNESREWEFTEHLWAGWEFAAFVCAYFTGGGGGRWTSIVGPQNANLSQAEATAVPADAAAWVQFGIATAVYTKTNPTNGEIGDGVGANHFCSPRAGTYAVMPHAPLAGGTVFDYEGIGAYGAPNNVSFAAAWTP